MSDEIINDDKVLFERYDRSAERYKTCSRRSAICYMLLAGILLLSLGVMILRITGVLGDVSCCVLLGVLGILLISDGAACRYFDILAKRSFALVVKYYTMARDVDAKQDDEDVDEKSECTCYLCGRADILLTWDSRGHPICDTCRELFGNKD